MQECWKEKKTDRATFKELQRKLQKQYDEAVAERAREQDRERMKEAAKKSHVMETDECVICLDGKAEWALIPCGHLCLCDVCKEGAASRECPMCCSKPTGICKIYHIGHD